jgi:hypothetical protein
VAGAAALLLELHRGWTPAQVKSALVSTAAAAWGDTARTQEAPVTLEGGGLVSLPHATDPQLFTDPVSLSFEDLIVTRGAASRALLLRLTDAGDGAGTWSVGLASQAATAGVAIDVPGAIAVPPGGEADVSVVVRAAADAPPGENYGFVVLRKGDVTRRIPYFFLVDRPALADAPVLMLKRNQSGSTRTGANRVTAYKYPVAPFGNAPDWPPMIEDGAERLYQTFVGRPAANAGVSVILEPSGAQIDPFYLGAQDESTVQGFAGTPVNVNALTPGYLLPVGAAGAAFPRQQSFFIAVDSGRERFTGRSYAGSYMLRSWVNDVTPPSVRLLTTRLAAGRPALTIGYRGVLVGASLYDPTNGVAVFSLPRTTPKLVNGMFRMRVVASDFQEAKNIDTVGPSIMPNTRSTAMRVRVVTGTVVNWVLPGAGACLTKRSMLAVAVSSTTGPVKGVRFVLDGKKVAVAHRTRGLWVGPPSIPKPAAGRHVLVAVAAGAKGATASARRIVHTCPS